MVLRGPKPTGTQPIDVQPVAMPRSATPRSATPRMAMSHLARIVYASATPSDVPRAQLDALLSAWRRQNASRGVTGFLLYHRASVFQVLEGFPDVIQGLYEAIARDPRHRFVVKLIDEPIADRGFGDWSMGHARLTSAELGAPGRLAPFLDPAFRYWHCDEDMARDLIAGFVTGSWRRSIV
jgi:hypothetical protein